MRDFREESRLRTRGRLIKNRPKYANAVCIRYENGDLSEHAYEPSKGFGISIRPDKKVRYIYINTYKV